MLEAQPWTNAALAFIWDNGLQSTIHGCTGKHQWWLPSILHCIKRLQGTNAVSREDFIGSRNHGLMSWTECKAGKESRGCSSMGPLLALHAEALGSTTSATQTWSGSTCPWCQHSGGEGRRLENRKQKGSGASSRLSDLLIWKQDSSPQQTFIPHHGRASAQTVNLNKLLPPSSGFLWGIQLQQSET